MLGLCLLKEVCAALKAHGNFSSTPSCYGSSINNFDPYQISLRLSELGDNQDAN